ncbi:MAG: hypothetical protein K2W94_04630 [Alphaproteobacteria bacterium]|nr:hypothetical protein [Alphaproteobacteria bacterium]
MSINQAVNEWNSICIRVKSLCEANVGSGIHGSHRNISIIAKGIYESIKEFKKAFENVLPNKALDLLEIYINTSIEKFKQKENPSIYRPEFEPTSNSDTVKEYIASLALIAGEISHYLNDAQTLIHKNVERTFLLLQRQLEVDGHVKADWEKGWFPEEGKKNIRGEVYFEKLGMAHFLGQNIWAFKVSAPKGTTDAILSEPGDIVDGAVLTEWKIVQDKNNYQSVIDKAKAQAEKYQNGVLGGIELFNYRYLVLVSKKYLKNLPLEIPDGNITYKIKNIATDPNTPGK